MDTLCYIWSKLLIDTSNGTCGVSSTCSCDVSSICSWVTTSEGGVIRACAWFVKSFNVLSVRALIKVSCNSGMLTATVLRRDSLFISTVSTILQRRWSWWWYCLSLFVELNHHIFYSRAWSSSFPPWMGVKVGRVNYNATCTTSYYIWNTGGCRKQYRVIKLLDDTDDDDVDNLFIEEIANEVHDHTAADVILRGLSPR